MYESDWEESLRYEKEHCEHCERLRKYGSTRLCKSHERKKDTAITSEAIRRAAREARKAQKRSEEQSRDK